MLECWIRRVKTATACCLKPLPDILRVVPLHVPHLKCRGQLMTSYLLLSDWMKTAANSLRILEGRIAEDAHSSQAPSPPPTIPRAAFSLTDVVLDDLLVPKRELTLPPIQLMKLSQRSDYLDWKTVVRLNFTMNSLGSMTFGTERFNEACASTDLQYLSTWVEKNRRASTTLALSLHVQLIRTLDVERFEPCMDAP
ncbi:hypothetical protein PHYPSEUDO_014884 [Phytophthora pseudosyringae]|uniref:Uncharacterized protein n=1 Tax=Phytophthora pseudosyringae TaxID=221518 RepID=A0A8T1W365_9STRA|nr:hypothetical protein PHYPSEUDO_014884 [Phytophthora pseudosyringae]